MASAGYVTEVKLFGRWSFEDVEVKDISLADYIACKPKYAQFLPHSQGRWQKKRFRKAQCPIVERMVCSMMRYGRNNGARPKSRTPLRPQLPPMMSERGSTVPLQCGGETDAGPCADSSRTRWQPYRCQHHSHLPFVMTLFLSSHNPFSFSATPVRS